MGKERNGSDDKVDGGESVGNSIKRAPLGRSDNRVDGKEALGNSLG